MRAATAIAIAGLLAAWIAVNNVKAGIAVVATTSAISQASAAGTSWPGYLNGSVHQSYNAAEQAITPANAGSLRRNWLFRGLRAPRPGQPGPGFLASPAVAGGAVYIGSDSGWFYKLGAKTGAVLARRFMGFQPARTCPGHGFADTATVQTDPYDGQRTVYVAAANGFLYALRASDLSVKWSALIALPSARVSDYFPWSSPTVVRGRIYIGIGSDCGHPLVRGGLVSFSQATGQRLAVFHAGPDGVLGGSVMAGAAVGPDGDVFAGTGVAGAGRAGPAYADSLVKLSPATLTPLAAFSGAAGPAVSFGGAPSGGAPFDGAPTIFGPYVGACDQNGVFYALRWATMRIAWSRRIGAAVARRGKHGRGTGGCSAAVFDGSHLYVGGPAVRAGGRRYRGSIAELDPATGRVLWRTGLPGGVTASPAMDGAGVIAVGIGGSSARSGAICLISAATGKILGRLRAGSPVVAQGVFADGRLFTATNSGVSAWSPRSG